MPNKKKLIFLASLLDEYVSKPFTTKVLFRISLHKKDQFMQVPWSLLEIVYRINLCSVQYWETLHWAVLDRVN